MLVVLGIVIGVLFILFPGLRAYVPLAQEQNTTPISAPCLGGNGGNGGYTSALLDAKGLIGCDIVVGEGGKSGEAGGDTFTVCKYEDGRQVVLGAGGGGPGGVGCINNN